MPLSPPADRDLLHKRDIALRGYQRADGLYDVEGHLTDRKTYGFHSVDRGDIAPGEPIHDMWMRMTVSEDLVIVACEAVTDKAPYSICPDAAPNFAALAGLTIRGGFLRAAAERIGGVHGCTHLREMLQQMATIAFQTTSSARNRRETIARARVGAPPPVDGSATLLDTCYAYASDSSVVQRRWPDLYTGAPLLAD